MGRRRRRAVLLLTCSLPIRHGREEQGCAGTVRRLAAVLRDCPHPPHSSYNPPALHPPLARWPPSPLLASAGWGSGDPGQPAPQRAGRLSSPYAIYFSRGKEQAIRKRQQ